MEKAEQWQLIESIAVIDIDTSLTLYKPSCNYKSMPVRIEMGFESRIVYLNAQGEQAQLQNYTPHPGTLPANQLLREK